MAVGWGWGPAEVAELWEWGWGSRDRCGGRRGALLGTWTVEGGLWPQSSLWMNGSQCGVPPGPESRGGSGEQAEQGSCSPGDPTLSISREPQLSYLCSGM